MSKRKAPLPLFDTLENFAEQVLPASIALPFAPADFQAVKGFLAQYQNNKMTFTAYRREIERLVQWAWYIHEKSVLTLNRADIEAFIKFCLKPPKAWIGFKREIRFTVKDGARLPNPRWRCFVAALAKNEGKRGKMASKDDFALSQKALAALFAGISSFYRYLVGENVVGANPVTQIRQKSHYLQTQQGKRKIRRLSEKAWTTVLACAQSLSR
jgi:site-specific recombinase XerC